MTMQLSPAAQAVLYAYFGALAKTPQQSLAAAFRAAADQVVPDDPQEAMHFTNEAIRLNRMSVRASFLAIAAELDGATRDPLEPNDLSHLTDEEFQALAPQGYHGV